MTQPPHPSSPCSPPRSSPLPISPSEALALLHQHHYLECITDRISDIHSYPFECNTVLIDQILHSITRQTSVLIVGDPGIGKRTLSLGLARRLITPPNPPLRAVYTLSLGAKVWHSARLDALSMQQTICEILRLAEVAAPTRLVLCIDDIDILSYVDRLAKSAAPRADHISSENLLRSLLFHRRILCLCTSVRLAYERLIQANTYYDEKFTESFRVLHMRQPEGEDALRIVSAHVPRLQRELGVIIPSETARAAVIFATIYLSHRAMPEKALELLQEASGLAVRENEIKTRTCKDGEIVGEERQEVILHRSFLDRLIQKWCGISAKQLCECLERSKLAKLSSKKE